MKLFNCLCFLASVGRVTADKLVKINEVSVKIGTVYTSEFSLSANGETASAAHTRSVYHNGVHTDYRLYAELFREH